MRTEAFITSMDAPLGNAVGNALEIAECVETLQGKGPSDLEAVVVRLASRMVELGGGAANGAEAESRVRDALASGAGPGEILDDDRAAGRRREHYPRSQPAAARRTRASGRVAGFRVSPHARCRARGPRVDAPRCRARKSGRLDRSRRRHPDCRASPVRAVAAGQPILELRYNDGRRLEEAVRLAESAMAIGEAPADAAPLILDHIR